jgi:hypothetical protein
MTEQQRSDSALGAGRSLCPEAIGKEVGHGRDQTQEMDELPKEVTFGVFGFFIWVWKCFKASEQNAKERRHRHD